jgi:hypothetical protein
VFVFTADEVPALLKSIKQPEIPSIAAPERVAVVADFALSHTYQYLLVDPLVTVPGVAVSVPPEEVIVGELENAGTAGAESVNVKVAKESLPQLRVPGV